MREGFKSQTPARILVVDDEPIIAITFSEIIKDCGYKVETAFSGEEAVSKAARFSPDLLVTDINMGAMNGVEAARHIIAFLPDCRVLFISGVVSLEEFWAPMPKEMVWSFARKPVPVLDLLEMVSCIVADANVGGGARSLEAFGSDPESSPEWRLPEIPGCPAGPESTSLSMSGD